jgi:hypothetical protein
MEFTLFYQGKIGSTKPTETKHKIRRVFHSQLKKLQELPPLKYHKNWFKPPYETKLENPVIVSSGFGKVMEIYSGSK